MKLRDIKLNTNDEKLLKFLARFKLMLATDAIQFYGTSYFQKRLQELKNSNYIKRFHKLYIKLTFAGLRYLDSHNVKCYQPCKNKKSIDRLVIVSKIGLELEKAKIPYSLSWEMKGNVYTNWSRRFIAKIKLRGEKYLVYYAKNDNKYIRQLQFDINKDINYQNVIVFTDNINIISKTTPFIFSNKISNLIIGTNRINTLLEFNKMDIKKEIENLYKNNVEESDFSIADYKVTNKNIIFMPYIDTIRIEALNNYYSLGFIDDKVEIISFKENLKIIKNLIDKSLNDKCSYKELEENIMYEE